MKVFCNKCKYYNNERCTHESNVEVSYSDSPITRTIRKSYKQGPRQINCDNDCGNFKKISILTKITIFLNKFYDTLSSY